MPKDPTRNQPHYKIDGDHLNEYEYARNSGAITEDEKNLPRPKETPVNLAEEPDGGAENDEKSSAQSNS